MLTNCPECGQQVSDQATTCPHCGWLLPNAKKIQLQSHPADTKFCTHCGAQILKAAVICPACGCPTAEIPKQADEAQEKLVKKPSALMIVAFVLMILRTIFSVFYSSLIPYSGWITIILILAYSIPMIVVAGIKMSKREIPSIGLGVCTLLFVSIIAGILMLVSRSVDK